MTSRSFEANSQSRHELFTYFLNFRFNDECCRLDSEALADFLCDASRATVGVKRIKGPLLGVIG